MYQLPKDVLARAKVCEQDAVGILLRTIYNDYDEKVHKQKDIVDIRYSQGVCSIVKELIKLTQPDHK